MANCSELNIVEQEMKKNALTCWISKFSKERKAYMEIDCPIFWGESRN